MKCRFEHEEDCCNRGSPQYMCKCKPDVCHSAILMTNADCLRAMTDEELSEFFARMAEGVPSDDPEVWLEWMREPAEGE